jgi:hypothetical protein
VTVDLLAARAEREAFDIGGVARRDSHVDRVSIVGGRAKDIVRFREPESPRVVAECAHEFEPGSIRLHAE